MSTAFTVQPSLPFPLLPHSGTEPRSGYSQCLEATEAPEHASMHGLQLVPRQHQLLYTCCSIKGTLSYLLDPIVAKVSRRKGQKQENEVGGDFSASSSLTLGPQHLCSGTGRHSS